MKITTAKNLKNPLKDVLKDVAADREIWEDTPFFHIIHVHKNL